MKGHWLTTAIEEDSETTMNVMDKRPDLYYLCRLCYDKDGSAATYLSSVHKSGDFCAVGLRVAEIHIEVSESCDILEAAPEVGRTVGTFTSIIRVTVRRCQFVVVAIFKVAMETIITLLTSCNTIS